MSALKDAYSPAFYQNFAKLMAEVLPDFDQQQFLSLIFDERFDQKELKERMRHTTLVLHPFLPTDFGLAMDAIEKCIVLIQQKSAFANSLAYIFIPDYIEVYGLDEFEKSMKAIETVTQFISCEFAVRPFLLKYGDQMMQQMLKWSHHPNHKVRRLASEGCRPRLPWAMAVPALKQNPQPILELLENLKNDPSEWVRRSVANNLNDISKDHPKIVLEIARRWKGHTKETDAIVKHACRTLLKKGQSEVLELYGLEGTKVGYDHFKILTPQVRVGENLLFGFQLVNLHDQKLKVRIEYAIYYRLQNGKLSKKVFKISERDFLPAETAELVRKQSFAPITTRKFYKGQHQLSLIINGEEKQILDFELI